MKTFPTTEAKALYDRLREQTGSFYEVRVIRDETVYGMDRLKSIKIMPALFEQTGPQIGGVNSAICDMTLVESTENWPRMAEFEVQTRLSSADESEKSVWITQGVFYTDERKNQRTNLRIVAYDNMLMTEQSWTDKVQNLPDSWPVTAQKAAEMIAEATGIEYVDGTEFDNVTPYIGLDTTSTAREVLKSIAVGCGGNWTVTNEGKYKLVPLADFEPLTPAIAGIAIAGLTVVGKTEADGEEINIINIGKKVRNLEICDNIQPITGVEIESPDGTIAFYGSRNGYVLRSECEFASTEIAYSCFSKIEGYVYRPFKADSARVDPICDVGDFVIIDNVTYPIITMNWNISPKIAADISAPFEEEIDHEYRIMSGSAKALRKSLQYTNAQIEQTRSYIQQTEYNIVQGVAASYVNNEEFNSTIANYSPTADIEQNYYNKTESDTRADALASEIQLTDSRLSIAFSELYADTNDAINAISYYIRYENGVVIVGKTDSPTSIRISNEQIGLYYGDQVVSYWNQNEQYTPKALRIPKGGKFTLGSILFQPRDSGNLSLMWTPENT